MPTIDQRAADALSALYEYLSVKGQLTIKPIKPKQITELVTDLLHLAQMNRFSSGDIAANALQRFEFNAVEQPLADFPICDECGGDDLNLDVIAHWDKAAGEPYVASVCDQGHTCNKCDKEVPIVWIHSTPQGP